MLFMPKLGIVMTAQNVPSTIKHPLVYEPIVQFQVEDRTVELIPLRFPYKKEKQFANLLSQPMQMDMSWSPVLTKLGAILEKHDIILKDGAVRNVARMPQRTKNFPYGIPEVIDKGSLSVRHHYGDTNQELSFLRLMLEDFQHDKNDPRWKRYQELIRKQPSYHDRLRDVGYEQLKAEGEFPEEYAYAKDHITQALRHHFDAAWPPEARHELREAPDKRLMANFWKTCLGMVDAKLLFSDKDLLPKEARYYQKKLKKSQIVQDNEPQRHR